MQRSHTQCRNALKHCRSYSGTCGQRDYNAAVAALNSLQSNHAAVEAVRASGPPFNQWAIPRMVGWARRVGYERSEFDRLNPIHIAGTKGKGSTSSFVSSILARYLADHRSTEAGSLSPIVGLYTSPHLRSVRERIQIGNQPVSEELFAKYFWEVWDRLEIAGPKNDDARATSSPSQAGGKPVYFHFLTLMALHCFMQEKVGTAVVECGIGGEYDTTNILSRPSVTGITSLGLDHQILLGDTLDSIAWNKAGIFKKGAPAFTVCQPETAMQVLRSRAQERETSLHVVSPHPAVLDIELGLQGSFQKTNASLAVSLAASHLRRLGFAGVPDPTDTSLPLAPEFVAGLQGARLGGRCDKRADAARADLHWYLDGGHTSESIDVASQWFTETSEPGATKILIFNQQKRDAPALVKRLHRNLASTWRTSSPFEHVIFCPNVTYAHGFKADLVSINVSRDDVDSLHVQRGLAATWRDIDPRTPVHMNSTIEGAIAHARTIADGRNVDVLVTGSLHLVGGVIEVLEGEEENQAD